MRRNLRAFFARSHATAQEIQSLEGMLRALAARRALRSKKNRLIRVLYEFAFLRILFLRIRF